MANESFSQNLRQLCGRHRSISLICREIGINRQQFNSYLNGSSRPSTHNLQRICSYFGVSNLDLEKPPADFLAEQAAPLLGPAKGSRDKLSALLSRAFPGDRPALRKHVGFYQTHFTVPAKEAVIRRGFVCLYEDQGRFFTKSFERSRESGQVYRFSKYEGLASLLGGKIFVTEFESLSADSIAETTLFPSYRRKLTYLSGLTFGATSSHQRNPFAAPVVWKFVGRSADYRAHFKACGLFACDSTELDPIARRILIQSVDFRNNVLCVDPP